MRTAQKSLGFFRPEATAPIPTIRSRNVGFAHEQKWLCHTRRQEVEYLVTRMKQELDRNRDVLSEESLDEYRQAMEIFRERGKGAR